jgi:hypothetical protein
MKASLSRCGVCEPINSCLLQGDYPSLPGDQQLNGKGALHRFQLITMLAV